MTATRAERRKLAAQLPVRVLAVLCLLGPFVFAILLNAQSGTPSDALFGVWVHTSGFAVSLVVLGFAANWGFPILAGVLAGDLFASEDRHGTWKTVLTRSRTLREVATGKVLVAAAGAAILGTLLAVSSVAAGLVLTGAHPMPDFGGRLLSAPHLLALTLLAWLVCLLPLLGYASLAILCSVAVRNGIAGVLGPMAIALLTQLLALIGNGVIVHLLLVGSAFDAWHGLFAARPFFGPLVVAIAVSAAWIAGSLGLTWAILRRREFVPGGTGRPGARWRPALRVVAGGIAAIALLALATNAGPDGVTARRLARALSPEFRRLTILQQDELGHPIPAGTRYRIDPVCNKRGARPVGPGDWSCTMNVYILLPGASQPLTDTPVTYDVSVQSNGCFKAASPPVIVGQADIRTRQGRMVVNPITTIYGCFNVL